jgi:LysR family glycine cleavage system transcriptional activator
MTPVNRGKLPLNSLRAFESAARHLSFSRAADELCVTHAAVSHQIKSLEDYVGVRLFHRSNRGVRLTEAGESLLPALNDAFDRITVTMDGLLSKSEGNAVQVTLTPSFAGRWLVPRLKRWRRSQPDLEIRLLPTLRLVDLARGEADLGVRCGVPPWPGMRADFMLPIHLTPICSPALLQDPKPLKEPRDLLSLPLIHADVGGHEMGEEWQTWFAAAGVSGLQQLDGLSFHDPGLALQAAVDGLGAAIGYVELAQPEIDSGALVRPFDLLVRHAYSYYLVYPEAKKDEARIMAFREWILDEAGRAQAP